MPPASGTNYRQSVPQPSAPPPVVKLDRIVMLPPSAKPVQGKVVLRDNTPRAGARVVFVNAEKTLPQEAVTADGQGRFNVRLTSGNWLVYLTSADGKQVFHSKIDVREADARSVVLVSW